MSVLLTVVVAAALVPASLRWLRVAQREHYLAGSTARFATRWWHSEPRNIALSWAAVLAAFVAFFVEPVALVAAAALTVGPLRLSIRGRTSKLAWTRRLRVVAIATGALDVVVIGIGLAIGFGPAVTVLLCSAQPRVIDLALAVLRPFERRASRRWVDKAARRLRQVDPTTVAITGSYGKTTTKGYVRHLAAQSFAVVASPASFNNTAGLSRTVNEQLTPGTEVFVAEMGTYGLGEIADMCEWVQPDIAAITAIGPVHLERFGSIERIVQAKAEILATAKTAVVNIDAAGLAYAAAGLAGNVIRCSGEEPTADVYVRAGSVWLHQQQLADGMTFDDPTNVACAVGIAVALDVPADAIASALATLPSTDHRRQTTSTGNGITIIDDTYNANPAGGAAALRALAALEAGKRVVVTPGMIELGSRQVAENTAFATEAAATADAVVVVGRTNRRALLAGAPNATAVDTRDEAVAWVRENTSTGDAVLYENDLPDHYP